MPTNVVLPSIRLCNTKVQNSASEVTTLWRYTNLFIIIIIIIIIKHSYTRECSFKLTKKAFTRGRTDHFSNMHALCLPLVTENI